MPRSVPPPPEQPLSRWWTLGLAAMGVVWLWCFCGWFLLQDLPNSGTPSLNRTTIAGMLPELLGANFTRSPGSGWEHLGQRVDLLATAAFLFAGAWGCGRLALRGLRINLRATSAEGFALAAGLGLSLWSLATLGLGLAGLLSRGLTIALLVASTAAGLWTLRTPASRATAESSPESRRLRCIALAVMAPFVLAMLLGAMLPSTDFDVNEYHLQGPKEYWQAGRVQFLPHNVYTSFPFLTEMLSLSAMVVRGDWQRGGLVGKTLLMTFSLVSACGAFALTRRLLTGGEHRAAADGPAAPSIPFAAWMAVLLLLTTPWVYRISTIAYVEGGLACYVVLALLAWVAGAQSADAPDAANVPRRWTLLTGLLAGSAAACKYPAVVTVVIPLGLAVVWRSRRVSDGAGGPLRRVAIAGAIYSAGVLIAFGPWLAKNLVETGNPVYPLLWSTFGGASFDAETNVRWQAAHAPPKHLFAEPGRIPLDLWRQLRDVALQSDWQSPLLFAFAPLVLLGEQRRRLTPVALLAAWQFLAWCWLTHRIDRFWVPMLPLLAVLAGAGASTLAGLLRRWRDNSLTLGPWIVSGLCAVLVAFCLLFNLAFITTGLCGFNAYLLDEAAARRIATGRSIQLLQAAGLRDGGRVLFVGEAAVFDADFPYLYNTVFDDSIFESLCAEPQADLPRGERPLRPADDVRRAFADAGLTHVCVNWSEVVRYRLPGSYGFSDFVHPRRFDELCEAGLLRRTPYVATVEWKHLSDAERGLIAEWAPELHLRRGDEEYFRSIEVFEVVDAFSPSAAADP